MDIKFLYYMFKKAFLPKLLTSNEYLYILDKRGIAIGKGTIFYSPASICVDVTRPWMIEIGEYCKITSGVVILQHDYSRSVLRRVYGEVIAEAELTKIGNNVFVGMNSIILMGAQIGDNVVIGAGSVVKGNIPDNCVIAGNPAKIICSLEEYYVKRKNRYIDEAKECAKQFYKKYNRKPSIEEMSAFFPLYLERDIDVIMRYENFVKLGGDEKNQVINEFLKTQPHFKNYDEFINEAIQK